MFSQRSVVLAGLALMLTAISSLAATDARAETKPPAARTIAPAVPLTVDQTNAIAAKGVPTAPRPETVLRPLKPWQPKATNSGPGPVAATARPAAPPMQSAERPSGAMGRRTPAFDLPAGKMPPREARPLAFRPGQLDPFALKPDEIAVIGGQIVHLPHAVVLPQRGRP